MVWYTILRYSNVYSIRQEPHEEAGGVIVIFTKRLLKNEEVAVFGCGKTK
jgi:UDP-glucose 4-epimerase